MTSTEIEWREPPAKSTQRRTVWAARLTPLLNNPTVWAMVQRCNNDKAATQTVNRLRHADNLPPGKWEFAADNDEVFARYVGPE